MRLGGSDLQRLSYTQESCRDITVYTHLCHIVGTLRSEDSRERDGSDNNGQLTPVDLQKNCSRYVGGRQKHTYTELPAADYRQMTMCVL